MKIRYIWHDSWVAPGAYLDWAKKRGHESIFTWCWKGDPLPAAADGDMLVVLGSWVNPGTTKEECPYFDAEAEKRLLREYIGAGKMVVGACLGAQMIGEAMGASFSHSPEPEIGPITATLTEEGKNDPFLCGFPPVFPTAAWHNDMPGLTKDAAVLASSEGCPRQIVRYGKYIYAFQTHMEFTKEIIEAGLAAEGHDLKKSGPFIRPAEELLSFDYEGMNTLLMRFLDAMTEAYLRGVTTHRKALPQR